MRTYYHVAGPEWVSGQDLICYDELVKLGRPPHWKWGKSPYAAADRDVVCLFGSDFEAESFAAEFGGQILVVDLRRARGLSLVQVEEGYPAVVGRIPAACLRKFEE